MQVIVAYLSCGCVVWYGAREYVPDAAPGGNCSRCGKPSPAVRATELRIVEGRG